MGPRRGRRGRPGPPAPGGRGPDRTSTARTRPCSASMATRVSRSVRQPAADADAPLFRTCETNRTIQGSRLDRDRALAEYGRTRVYNLCAHALRDDAAAAATAQLPRLAPSRKPAAHHDTMR